MEFVDKTAKIVVSPLASIPVDGGGVMHAMKNTDIGFTGFGEAYFSWINSDKVKAWKCHTKMTMNLIVPVGCVRFVFKDDRTSVDQYRVAEVGDKNYCRLTVPPGVWFGFQGLDSNPSLVLNIGSIPHDPEEVVRQDISYFNYCWR